MLIAILLALLFGGGGNLAPQLKAQQKEMKNVISEKNRRKEIASGYKQQDKLIKEDAKADSKFVKELTKWGKNPDAKKEDLISLMDQHQEEQKKHDQLFFEKRIEVKKLIREEEWKQLIGNVGSKK